MRLQRIAATALGVLLAASAAMAQEVVVYPAKGQSADQMEKDKYECYQWAKGQSGFDPMAPPTPTSAPPPETDSGASVGGGLVKGAVLGSVIGGVTGGDWGHGAAYGAAAGGLIGGARKRSDDRRNEQAREQWEQQQAAQYQQQRNNYNRNFAACMQGREYTVN